MEGALWLGYASLTVLAFLALFVKPIERKRKGINRPFIPKTMTTRRKGVIYRYNSRK